jgi:hypothetical protein
MQGLNISRFSPTTASVSTYKKEMYVNLFYWLNISRFSLTTASVSTYNKVSIGHKHALHAGHAA